MQNVARWAVLAPLFIIPFLSLYVSSEMFFPFITGKNFAFRVLVEIALAGWIFLALADRRYRPQFSWVLVSFSLLVAWMFIADLFAMNAHKAFWSNFERMDGWVTLIHVFALFVVAGSVLTVDKLWRKWWMTFIGAAALVCTYALMQLGGIAQIHQSGTRLDATLGNSEYLAGFLLLALAITLWQAFETKGAGLRNSLFALAAIEVLVLFSTGTRGSFVALIVAAVAGGLLWLFQMGKKGRRGALIFLAGVLIFAGGFYALRNTALIQNSPNLARFADISLASLDTRFKIWDMAIDGVQERPVVGWGHEGYNYVFNKYYIPSLHGQESWFDRAHNIYLDWLVAGGVPALLFFLALGVSALMAVYRSQKLQPWERVLIISAFIAYAVQGLAVFDNLFTYLPLALLLAYAHSLKTKPIAAIERIPEAKGAMLDTVVAPITVIAVLVVIYMVNVPTYAAGKDLIKGLTPGGTVEERTGYFTTALEREPFATQEIREQLLSFAQQIVGSNATDAQKQAAVQLAATEIENEIKNAPEDARLYALYASFLRSIGQFEQARVVAAKARELSPNKQSIMIEQGIVEWQADKPEAAKAFFDEAYALSPTSEDLAIYLAAADILAGQPAEGKALLEEHFGTTTVNSLILGFAYQKTQAWNDLITLLQLRYREQNDATTGFQLAVVYAQAGRKAEARAQVYAVMSAHPDATQQGTQLLTELNSI